MAKKNALGKGLDALLRLNEDVDVPGVEEKIPVVVTTTKKGESKEALFLSLDDIKGNPDQPRKVFDDEGLRELADSIKSRGVIQPILVQKGEDGNYMVIAGERRLRAAKLAGLEKIPAIIGNFTPHEIMEIALIENIQRKNLTAIEEALGYKNIMDSLKITQADVAERVGKNRSTVANSLRLLSLSENMQQAVNEDKISAGHARSILSVVNPADRTLLFNRILDKGLSVREAEREATNFNKGIKNEKTDVPAKAAATRDPDLTYLEERLFEKLGTKVAVKGSLGKGKIEIAYYSSDDLSRVFDLIAGKE